MKKIRGQIWKKDQEFSLGHIKFETPVCHPTRKSGRQLQVWVGALKIQVIWRYRY